MAAMVTWELKYPNSDFGSIFPEIHLSEYEIKQMKNMFRSSVNDAKDQQRVVECNERSCGMILLKSFREIEAKYIDFLSTLLRKKVCFNYISPKCFENLIFLFRFFFILLFFKIRYIIGRFCTFNFLVGF